MTDDVMKHILCLPYKDDKRSCSLALWKVSKQLVCLGITDAWAPMTGISGGLADRQLKAKLEIYLKQGHKTTVCYRCTNIIPDFKLFSLPLLPDFLISLFQKLVGRRVPLFISCLKSCFEQDGIFLKRQG